MEAQRGFVLLLGLVATFFLFFLSYQWGIQQYTRAGIHQRQISRKQQLREMCESNKEAFSEGKHILEDLSSRELENLIVDDKHGIIYCYIPKVACTNWKRIFFALKQNETNPDLMSIPHKFVHEYFQSLLEKQFPVPEMKVRLKHYTKFLFVRDPFIRLISAYRDKFQKNDQYFYENFAWYILSRYGNVPDPPKTADEAFASGVRPSFNNFIQYLVDPKTGKEPFEPHWSQMHRLCHPCLIEYDFIGHQETLQEDAEHLLRLLKLEHIEFPTHEENMTTANFLIDWYTPVPLEDRRKLYKLYEKDFRLFGYRKPDELLNSQ